MNEQITENMIQTGNMATETVAETAETVNPQSSKKKFIIWSIMIVAVIGIIFAFTHESKFETVKKECKEIVGSTGIMIMRDDYFTLDTYPDSYADFDENTRLWLMAETPNTALKAIQHANERLGFNSSIYSKMLETSALMGRQSEENSKYKVSWTYHPDDGLEVTYEKK